MKIGDDLEALSGAQLPQETVASAADDQDYTMLVSNPEERRQRLAPRPHPSLQAAS